MNDGIYAVGPTWLPLIVWGYWLFALTYVKHSRRIRREYP